MRKEDPSWRFALAASPTTEGWIVTLESDSGTFGYGYASATAHMGASMEGLKGTLERLQPILLDQDPLNMSAIRKAMDRSLLGNNQAKAAIDTALFDLVCQLSTKSMPPIPNVLIAYVHASFMQKVFNISQ